jgi:hypothetical protein
LAREDTHDVLRACEAAAALGDGASVYALQAVLHTAMASAITVDDLAARGFLSIVDDHVDLGRSFTAALGVDDALRGRLAALRLSGALDVMTSAELAVDCGAPDAATQLCHAARAALSSGDVAVAVRLAARAAATPNVSDDVVSATLRVVASTVGTALTVSIAEGNTPTVVDPSTIEATAHARETDGDGASAARLRALAALLQGDATPAVLVGHGARSVRDQILGALGLARTGDLRGAVHVAAVALSWARHDHDTRGISAALSLLASLYAALERFDEAARFTEASRAIGG